jgi:biotin operon repressor
MVMGNRKYVGKTGVGVKSGAVKPLRVYVPTQLWVYLRKRADAEQTTMTRLVNMALFGYFKDAPDCADYKENYMTKPLTDKQHNGAMKRKENIAKAVAVLCATDKWVSRTDLAKQIGCSRKSITRYVIELTAKYPIEVKREGRGNSLYFRWKEV